jgi:hypothetical protein
MLLRPVVRRSNEQNITLAGPLLLIASSQKSRYAVLFPKSRVHDFHKNAAWPQGSWRIAQKRQKHTIFVAFDVYLESVYPTDARIRDDTEKGFHGDVHAVKSGTRRKARLAQFRWHDIERLRSNLIANSAGENLHLIKTVGIHIEVQSRQ